MDFQQFNAKVGADDGRVLHLPHIQTGEPLWHIDKSDPDNIITEPVGITVRGIESKTVLAALASRNRKNIGVAISANDQADDQDAAAAKAVAKAIVIEFHHIERDGRPLTTSEEDIEWFFNLSASFVKEVRHFAADAGNFLAVEKPSQG